MTLKPERKKLNLLIGNLYKSHLSAANIAARLKLTLSQVYRSLSKQNIQRRVPKEQAKIRFASKPLSFNYKRPQSLKGKLLEISALMLYLGEGAKTGFTVDFANSDPRLLKLFMLYLKNICQVRGSRLRFYLYCFSNQKPHTLISFWSKQLHVKRKLFTKPYVRKVSSNNRTRAMKHGVLHIRYSDKKLLHKILADIDQFSQKLVK